MPGYETGRRRQGRRTDADPFQYLQYPELTEQRVGIGVEGDGEIKCGCWGLPGYQTDKCNLLEEIFWLKVCRDAGAKPALGQHCTLLSGLPLLRSQGNVPFRRE